MISTTSPRILEQLCDLAAQLPGLTCHSLHLRGEEAVALVGALPGAVPRTYLHRGGAAADGYTATVRHGGYALDLFATVQRPLTDEEREQIEAAPPEPQACLLVPR